MLFPLLLPPLLLTNLFSSLVLLLFLLVFLFHHLLPLLGVCPPPACPLFMSAMAHDVSPQASLSLIRHAPMLRHCTFACSAATVLSYRNTLDVGIDEFTAIRRSHCIRCRYLLLLAFLSSPSTEQKQQQQQEQNAKDTLPPPSLPLS